MISNRLQRVYESLDDLNRLSAKIRDTLLKAERGNVDLSDSSDSFDCRVSAMQDALAILVEELPQLTESEVVCD